MPLSVGDRVGRFKLVGLLGEGGMGAVYRAEDSVLGRAVALKILHASDAAPGAQPDSARAAKLLHEARAAAALNHPNAVAVFDVGEADGVAYIAMELLSGDTLRKHMSDAGAALGKRLAWLLDVASAIEAAHKRGIVHRDIKPENVFVRSDGVIKVLDFGIARRVSVPVDATGATLGGELAESATATAAGTGDVAGTPVYMAPEQLKGEPIDGKTDQFGWGVVAYELLTGSLPWNTSLGALQLVSQILSRIPEAPSTKRKEIPKGVDRVVLRALEKKRADRFEDMGALVDALSEASGGEPAGAEEAPVEPPEVAVAEKVAPGLGGGKRRRAVGAALLGVALVVGGVGLARRAQRSAAQGPNVAGSASAGPVVGPPDYGSKMSSNEAAFTEYRAGMQAIVDASDDTARKDFQRATKLDPGFAAAHLRRALLMYADDDVGREHLGQAFDLRADLGPHDRALLDALAAVVHGPAKSTEVEQKLAALEAAPDADGRYVACRLRFVLLNQQAEATRACRAASQIDGAHAGAHGMEGVALKRSGDTEAARAALSACVRDSPSAVNCLDNLFDLAIGDGRCEEAVSLARKLVSIDPDKAAWHGELLIALFDVEEPRETYDEEMKQYFIRMNQGDREVGEAQTRFMLAVLRGDFNAAERYSRDWERAVAHEDQELPDHWNAFYSRWLLETEMGRARDAGDLAARYSKQRAGWNTSGDAAAGELAAVLYDSGKIGRAELAKKRNALSTHAKPLPLDEWLSGFGHAVTTSDDAREAAAALDDVGEVPRGLTGALYYTVGDVLMRAGEPAKAIPFLRRAAASCMALLSPFEQTRAYADLASALAETGDTPGACAALRTVQSRWGSAPASTTAAVSRRLAGKLGCSP